METTTVFSLEPLNDTESRLIADGSTPLLNVPGVKLEDQYALADGRFLVITSEDCPYEEMLHIILARPGESDFECVNIGRPYTPGIYANPQVITNGNLQFSFSDNGTFRVSVRSHPARNIRQLFNHNAISYDSYLAKRSLSVEQIAQ
ncbi:hypothetical protein [Simiduia agarivorans]|uniref:Uncharacterized protein n=1 Tax=Simiduia agarivorans (strain DSM 21679 / JCM 13881 / BCRC 17597 / SA1) TaxID=1117647 RepID=K4KHC8_SIMAS|nr:hypothetical protein [Simiduia agarivorans]AFU98514.2 hypothetical protein M5M_06595 [Simiduia agarivorans SA1 = DSM 21679]